MISARLRLAAASAACLLVGFAAAGPARASIDFGSDLSQAPDTPTCFDASAHSCTIAITALPVGHQAIGGPTAPSDGVVVGWKLKSGSQAEPKPVRLHVLRGDAGIAISPTETLEKNAAVYNYAARISVKKGDRLAVDFPELPGSIVVGVINTGAATGASFDIWKPMLGEFEDHTATFGTVLTAELLLQATLEPDADGDGWGDETQDKCVGVAGPNDGCQPPVVGPPAPGGPTIPTEAAPNTTITKAPKGTSGTRKGTFRFTSTVAGSAFQCKLDKKPWKTCKSPKIYRSLNEGRHTFKVKAVGPTAVPDPTPAKRSFKVEL